MFEVEWVWYSLATTGYSRLQHSVWLKGKSICVCRCGVWGDSRCRIGYRILHVGPISIRSVGAGCWSSILPGDLIKEGNKEEREEVVSNLQQKEEKDVC